MSARDDILARVREAVSDAPEVAEPPRDYRRAPELAGEDLLAQFVERVEDYRATVTRCTEAEVPRELERLLDGVLRVVVPDGFPWSVPGGEPDNAKSAAELNDVDAVVTTSSVGIAETGTVVLSHGPGQGRRALSLVPDLHVCVIHADQVVAGVNEAVGMLDPLQPQTWISGPSATSDIELSRVEGVHGPRTLHVLLVE
ncbi:lactate utilization protein C [Nocardioides sp. JQ2195]|uniref:LutC/YkgG family protein n=1 Tax=Nocardioides sp. JQ2195 TaxID=2592334 RepID=UPI00143E6353|nr:lactate utilization protein C [Nocardioides sp. JQ2195]QIX26648.1 lactate utilization protein C [Nocardioides sp. JQ2195]